MKFGAYNRILGRIGGISVTQRYNPLKEAAGKHQIEWVWTPKEVAGAGYEREDAVELARMGMEEHSR